MLAIISPGFCAARSVLGQQGEGLVVDAVGAFGLEAHQRL